MVSIVEPEFYSVYSYAYVSSNYSLLLWSIGRIIAIRHADRIVQCNTLTQYYFQPIKTPTPRFDPQKQQSTTGYALMMAGGAVVYGSKAHALSCTEAKFFAAVAIAKVVPCLRSVLRKLHIPMIAPTTIYDYEDNEACIKIINSNGVYVQDIKYRSNIYDDYGTK